MELELQSKRCEWERYNWESAALAALIYQCPDKVWRSKIIRDKMTFRVAVDWGVNNLVTQKAGKKIDKSHRKVKRDSQTP